MRELRRDWVSIGRGEHLGAKLREITRIVHGPQKSLEDDVYERRVEFNHLFGRYHGGQ